jgi:hypothetical protein
MPAAGTAAFGAAAVGAAAAGGTTIIAAIIRTRRASRPRNDAGVHASARLSAPNRVWCAIQDRYENNRTRCYGRCTCTRVDASQRGV